MRSLDGAQRVRIQGEEVEVKARISLFELYSGHADASELVAWLKARTPVKQQVFLTHGEEAGLGGLRGRLAGLIPDDKVIIPRLDDAFQLTPGRCLPVEVNEPRRLRPEKIARLDWHNDLSKLLLDVNEAVSAAADERGRAAIIRRMRRALEDNDAWRLRSDELKAQERVGVHSQQIDEHKPISQSGDRAPTGDGSQT